VLWWLVNCAIKEIINKKNSMNNCKETPFKRQRKVEIILLCHKVLRLLCPVAFVCELIAKKHV